MVPLNEIIHGEHVFEVTDITHSFRDGAWVVYRACSGEDFYDIDLIFRDPNEWPILEAGLTLARDLPRNLVAPIVDVFEPDNLPGYLAIVSHIEEDHYTWERLNRGEFEEDEAVAIFTGVLKAVEGLHEVKVYHPCICLENIYISGDLDVRLTGLHSVVKYEGELTEEMIECEMLALGNCLKALLPTERSKGIQDLVDGLVNGRLTLHELKKHSALPNIQPLDPIEGAVSFGSVREVS
jgi:hypothetical protein